jgi:hypothetical protein
MKYSTYVCFCRLWFSSHFFFFHIFFAMFNIIDGLYVLLKPAKKNQPTPRVPPHLLDYIVKDLRDETCPWSLSGPQFPQPTAIQQRYCYPKGNVAYSSQKGGALWTMYDSSGKEDLEFRLLHVYFSAKRAGILSATPSPARRRRHHPTPPSFTVSSSVPSSPWPPTSWNPHSPNPTTSAFPTMMYHPPSYPHAIPPPRNSLPFPPPQYYKRPRLLPAPPSASRNTSTTGTKNMLIAPPENTATEEDASLSMMIPNQHHHHHHHHHHLLDEDALIVAKSSFEFLPLEDAQQSCLFDSFLLLDHTDGDDDNGTNDTCALQKRLQGMQHQLLEWIETQPQKEQLYTMVRAWARQLVGEEQTLLSVPTTTTSTTTTAEV